MNVINNLSNKAYKTFNVYLAFPRKESPYPRGGWHMKFKSINKTIRLENWFVQAFCGIVSQFGDMLRCVSIIFNLYDD